MNTVLCYIKNMLKNVKYLFTNSLKEKEKENNFLIYQNLDDFFHYEIENGKKYSDIYRVLDENETIDLLLNFPKSFCRFGDGETAIINGESIPFQKYDKRLADTMVEILKSEDDNIYVGINYYYFHSVKGFTEFNRKFYWLEATKHRDFLIKNCNWNRVYINAGFNQIYQLFEEYDFERYFDKIKQLFLNRDLVIFCGEGILEEYEYDVFELAHSKEIVNAPRKDAFEKYDEILEKALYYDKNKLLCFILGPTSKVLVYELSKKGYCAWDIGHLAKDYNSYRKKMLRTEENVQNFFKPD